MAPLPFFFLFLGCSHEGHYTSVVHYFVSKVCTFFIGNKRFYLFFMFIFKSFLFFIFYLYLLLILLFSLQVAAANTPIILIPGKSMCLLQKQRERQKKGKNKEKKEKIKKRKKNKKITLLLGLAGSALDGMRGKTSEIWEYPYIYCPETYEYDQVFFIYNKKKKIKLKE